MSRANDSDFASMLDALRAAESEAVAPPHIEAVLMKAWDAQHERPPATVGPTALSRIGSLAAALLVTVGLTVLGGLLRSAGNTVSSRAAVAVPTIVLVGEPVHEGEQVRLVRMRMPAAALHALGVTSAATAVDDVYVDVIVGEDGVARALSLNP